MMNNKFSYFLCLSVLVASGCSSPQVEQTLRTLDTQNTGTAQNDVFVKPKSEEEIKAAYYDYINSAARNDKSRLTAITRLAELEMDRINALMKNARTTQNEAVEDRLYRESLEKTLSLLQTSLREYPDAKSTDRTLYQLARTYDQLGDYEQSLATLKQLGDSYPASPYYAEAQFRIAENAFIEGDYITAEDAYSEAVFTSSGDSFYERSLFKRGWARYKQGLYLEAADDYLAALKHHRFDDYEVLSNSEKDQFDEYFRAIGLTFANLQSAETLHEYFSEETDFKYLYHVYKVISDIYLKQERFSDAAETLQQFVTANPASSKVPAAYLQQLEIWRLGKFKNRFQEAMEDFYVRFNPESPYWRDHDNPADKKVVAEQLRHYILLVANWYQEDYQRRSNSKIFNQANDWYQRYLAHYTPYAQQDKVYITYAELLAAENRLQDALGYFELAAYDGDIVLNKEAAYATIEISNKLHQSDMSNPAWIEKHLQYSQISAQLYQADSRYHTVALHAAEMAFNNERYEDAIGLSNVLPDSTANKIVYNANVIKGLAYLQLTDFKQAELIFSDLQEQDLSQTEQRKVNDNLALAIYRQAESSIKANQINDGIANYARVAQRAPDSEIAPKALYEAIALAMQHEQWNEAITRIHQFQQLYPRHSLNKDATRQLSAAYLNSGQGLEAARAFEQLSTQEENQDVKMAALWKAAELYESKNNYDAAIRSYRSYANTYTRPYPQYMEAMVKLTQLYQQTRDLDKSHFWQEKIILADKQVSKNHKTERTNFIAANASLNMARAKHQAFERKQLIEPLTQNLRVKKKLMQDTIALYGQASAYNDPAITTESTYAIGKIYQHFATALLDSERPGHLQGEELEQYNILLEDQAFPFEEKAIEFYEINLARTKDGTQSDWIVNSYKALATLFPVRYNRQGKLDIYRDETL